MLEFRLTKPIEVMNREAGAYVAESIISVVFAGRKGLEAIKKLQDTVMNTFSAQAGKGRELSKEEIEAQKEKEKDEVMTVEKIVDMLEVTGASAVLFKEVTETLKDFAKIGDSKLTDLLMDEMELDDLDGLYAEVLKTFLLPKLVSRMNSMKK